MSAGLWLSTCSGKTPLMASVAKKISLKHNKQGRPTSAYKCRYCKQWHIGNAQEKIETKN